MLTLLHASDFQHGRPFLPHAAEALVRFAGELDPDVTVVSGDLTQRARRSEFVAARQFLDTLPFQRLVVPGNHDVPLYRVWERLTDPFGNYRTHISPDLDAVHRFEVANEGSTVMRRRWASPVPTTT